MIKFVSVVDVFPTKRSHFLSGHGCELEVYSHGACVVPGLSAGQACPALALPCPCLVGEFGLLTACPDYKTGSLAIENHKA